jgi:uncharacterized secreted protein with C-terminal beta-propeller domain
MRNRKNPDESARTSESQISKWETTDEIKEKILASADDMPIPESLFPENMAKKLEQNSNGQRVKSTRSAEHGSQLPRTHFTNVRRMAEAAAVLVLLLVVGGVSLRWAGQQNGSENGTDGRDTNLAMESAETAAEDVDKNSSGTTKQHTSEAGKLYHLAADYEEVYGVIQLADTELTEGTYNLTEMKVDPGDSMANEGVEEASPETVWSEAADLSEAETDSSGGAVADLADDPETDFSTTNLQEAGVDESDIVKTDGNYIYIVKERRVQIVKISDGTMETVGSICPDMTAADSLEEVYLDGDRLYLILSCVETTMSSDASESGASYSAADVAMTDVYSVSSSNSVKLLTYDISHPANAQLLGTVTQDGYYYTSRKVGNYVYIFSRKNLYGYTEDTIYNAIPSVQGVKVSADCIYIPEEAASELIITSVDGEEPDRTTDQIVVMNSGASVYMGSRAIYLYNSRYEDDKQYTEIAKFSYDNGCLDGVAATSIVGTVEDTFAISEKKDDLRVLTTDWYSADRTNMLYILDENLSLCGEIDDIATGESIYAARYLGDMAYFITYRNTDPLYVADLSDPENPALLGNVEISGFSDYLHPYGDGKLLGIGYETDENSATLGVKLVMFDTDDPAEPTILDTEVLEEMDYTLADASYKSVMIDADKNLIGFLTADYDSEINWHYFVYRWEEGRFREVFSENLGNNIGWIWDEIDVRGLYVGNYFYLVTSDEIKSYDMENAFALCEELGLDETKN